MGAHDVRAPQSPAEAREVMRAVLADVSALERMLEEGRFESGVTRIGAEQELFLVDGRGRPVPYAMSVLERLGDPMFTTELARFNLETNLAPLPLDGAFLSTLEANLATAVDRVREAAQHHGSDLAMVGILPSLDRGDLHPGNMTPQERYRAMSDALAEARGEAFSIYIRGTDVVEIDSDTVMLESANTSFQLHLQVDADDFAHTYNIVQALTGPLLAPAVNSPTLFGQRLWQETRISLFERATDARNPGQRARHMAPRVGFGSRWMDASPVEIFHEDLARHSILLMRDPGPDPLELLDRGELPDLSSLALFNGTVWRWNRPCFGVHDGVAHLRIENRVLPSGPTVLDEIANAALFYGTVLGLRKQIDDIRGRMSFRAAHRNFLAAARSGLDARFEWLDKRHVSARDLLLDELIPLAWITLTGVGVPESDLERTLGTMRERVFTSRTASRWLLRGLDALEDVPASRRTRTLTAAMITRASTGEPVHSWPDLNPEEIGDLPATELRDVMTTDVLTLGPEDLVELARRVLAWHEIHHLPIEEHGRLVGMVSDRELDDAALDGSVAIREVMLPVTDAVAGNLPLDQAVERLKNAPRNVLFAVDDRGVLLGLATLADL